jgi:hypothetical protein
MAESVAEPVAGSTAAAPAERAGGATGKSLYLSRNFLLAYAAAFISLFGSKLVMLSYLAYIFDATGNALAASVLFAAEWGTCLLVGVLGARLIDRANAKRLLVILNVAAAAVTLTFVAFTSVADYPFAVAIIVARALLSHAMTFARIKALVQLFTRQETDIVSGIFNSSLFMATATAGAVGVLLLKYTDFATIVCLNSALFLLAALLFACTRPDRRRLEESTARSGSTTSPTGERPFAEAFRIITGNRALSTAVFYMIIAGTSFQATYEVLITTVPQVWFGLGKPGTALFFTLESVFVTLGSFLYQVLLHRRFITEQNQARLNLSTLLFAAATYLAVSLFRHQLYVCLAFFNAMVIATELVWTHQFRQMIACAPAEKVASVSGLQMATGYTLMGMFALGFSALVNLLGIRTAMWLNVLLLVLLVAGWERFARAGAPRAAANRRESR